MAVLIVYMTSHGCAEKGARLLQELLPVETTLINLEHTQPPEISRFDAVIIGGSIRIGRIQKPIRRFCEKHLEVLLTRRIGLFICCMHRGRKAKEQLRANFPEPLILHATATGIFGGELDFGSMTAFEQMLIRDIIGITENVSLFNKRAVGEFARKMMNTRQ